MKMGIYLFLFFVLFAKSGWTDSATEGTWVAIRNGAAHVSGFALEMDGEKFLVSDESIVRAGGSFGLQIPKGMKMVLGDFQVSMNSSLIRFRLKNDLPAFTIGRGCRVDDVVDLCGVVSLRSGMKRIPASVVSIEKNEITVDQDWEPEMWGGPVLNEKGMVLGVLSDRILPLTDVEWESVQWKAYHAQTDALHDVDVFCSFVESLSSSMKEKKGEAQDELEEAEEVTEKTVLYSEKNEKLFFRYRRFHEYLMDLYQLQSKIEEESRKIPEYFRQIEEITSAFEEKKENKEARDSEQNLKMRIGLIRTRLKTSQQRTASMKRELNRLRWKKIGEVAKFISGMKWETARLKKEAQKKIGKLQSLLRL